MATYYMTAESELYHTGLYDSCDDELYHHGVIGMKWGVRRYQNPDGTLTSAGKERYGKVGTGRMSKSEKVKYKNTKYKLKRAIAKAEYTDINYKNASKAHDRALSKYGKGSTREKETRSRESFWKANHIKVGKEVRSMASEAQKRYGTSRIKDVPTKSTNYGNLVYRRLISTPEFKGSTAISSLAAAGLTAATGNIWIPNLAGIAAISQSSRYGSARRYGQQLEKKRRRR